ncbi:undecaprenyldiphospho-muramoylpentapeptide beta-N-acetylglucosaminyltransferase [Portibacter lacus]|uniref:UDP-N-acetylglucosamine--N-acetylmuramyl-(pentapeptide) pyrophosphoryl-undecaprenol N-acetylglucosamine transferase n=1 Tax=Portibacter lacus TaxID=1099794 RepID=A0AA37SKY0_9BACT|nr:undecaprenyldiphospho-muramoylpentapeptide beta-N-acetylglucosaminyltransferase [Portibacter lacus]GLR15767.1 UDP-N-acetylglucosamine--N-acetylmuramyl-(pentapeptide) pyrophosphoryl-undecaprenol N-acetylglucosamine transferase [Portibacter lacus]
MKVIISGGGTGGHIYPAIAIANALKEIKPDADILFVGAKGKLEMEKVPKAGYPIEGLWISGFHRKLTLRNLMFPIKLLSSLFRAGKIVKRFKPDVVVGVGGYASGPLLQMAVAQKVPALIQEQNSYAGVTNKILASKVQKICVAYPDMEKYFPKEKIVFTGNPVRKDISDLADLKMEAVTHYRLDQNKKTTLLFGGSLGARMLNEAMEQNTKLIADQPDVQWIWQMGSIYYEEFVKCETAQLPNVFPVAFLERMELAYAAADVVICRAGALTVSELCIVGKPAILVPSPNVAEDHQTKNAMALVNAEAAVLVKDAEVKEKLVSQVMELMDDAEKQKTLTYNIKALAKETAAKDIANEIIELSKK